MGSSVVAACTCAHPGVRWVHPGSFNSHAQAEGVNEFISSLWDRSRPPWGSLGSLAPALGFVEFILGRWVRSFAPLEFLGSSGVAGSARARPGAHWVHHG